MFSKGMTEPPSGVILGESVPPENQEDRIEENRIETLMGELKGRDQRYREMSESELRDIAVEVYEKIEEDRE